MIHSMFNKGLLIQYREPQFKGQYMDPVPSLDIINKEEEYKVKEILNYRKQGHNMQFLVHWRGYGNEHDQ